jgi:hypothetical protein
VYRKRIALAFLAVMVCSTFSLADSTTVNFTRAFGAPGTPGYSTVPSVGSLTLTLNPDGTISAQLSSSWLINGFGLSAPGVQFSGLTGYEWTDWTTHFGYFDNALFNTNGYCSAWDGVAYDSNCTARDFSTELGDLKFTISRDGGFNSVFDIANAPGDGGGENTEFFLFVNDADSYFLEAGANAAVTPVPEPAGLSLLFTGVLGFGAAMRKRFL